MNSQTLQQRLLINTFFTALIRGLTYTITIPLFFIIYYLTKQGIQYLNLDFFTKMPAPIGEPGGGALNAIVGSLLIIVLAACIAIPIGILIGIYLSENKKTKYSSVIRIIIETLQGVPSIVFGIVAYAWIVLPIGNFSGIAASVSLALIMLPMVTKSTEETLLMLPESLKEASYALGANYYTTMIKVILPSGINGILAGILVGIARISGETAPLLFTAFGNSFFSTNMAQPINALPLLIYNYATSPYEEWINIAWAASLFLIIFVLSLSLISKSIKNT